MLLCLIRIIVSECKIHLCNFACNVFGLQECRITPNLKAHKVVDFLPLILIGQPEIIWHIIRIVWISLLR